MPPQASWGLLAGSIGCGLWPLHLLVGLVAAMQLCKRRCSCDAVHLGVFAGLVCTDTVLRSGAVAIPPRSVGSARVA